MEQAMKNKQKEGQFRSCQDSNLESFADAIQSTLESDHNRRRTR